MPLPYKKVHRYAATMSKKPHTRTCTHAYSFLKWFGRLTCPDDGVDSDVLKKAWAKKPSSRTHTHTPHTHTHTHTHTQWVLRLRERQM
jgi:hypothetical protein